MSAASRGPVPSQGGEGPRHTLITPTAGAADPASGAREVKAGGRGRFT